MTTLLDNIAAHPIVSVLVGLGWLWLGGRLWDVAAEVYRRVRRMPLYNEGGTGNEGFLTPGIAFLLLTAAHGCALTAGPRVDGYPGVDWLLGGQPLTGVLALPDQPAELEYLGWLHTESFREMEFPRDPVPVVVTAAGWRALALIEAGDLRGYDRHLRASWGQARAARAETKVAAS